MWKRLKIRQYKPKQHKQGRFPTPRMMLTAYCLHPYPERLPLHTKANTEMEGRLLCCEAESELRAQDDPVLLQSRVLWKLLAAEERYIPSASYFQCVQKEVHPHMRKMLTNWMLEVCEDQKCGEQVFTLAVNCLDRFLSLTQVEKRHLQLLGATCLLLVSKLKETNPITIENLCMYSDYSFTERELRSMELLVLNKLKWDIEAVTPQDFLSHLLELLNIPVEKMTLIRKHAETFIALCTTDCTFIALPPSLVAAASVSAAVGGLRLEKLGKAYSSMVITKHLAHAIQCDPLFLKTCQEQIEISLHSTLHNAQRNQVSDSKMVEEIERSSTPTDVLDIDL
ncbi:G1/S-specific cyclin-D1-like [Bombina bombina]|uniref:G1/S-specific cyclin-D1-like n=1 Tax=Bombina bombina TaxID=8345 RepID=UPI00235AC368|nr:G1/S-specific cyclin-D1-like [Bombina bombina]